MGDLTAHMPKCMVSVAGRTLLDWQLSALRAAGVREIGLVTGYRADDIRADDLTEFTNREWATSNMVRSLTCAGPWLVGADTVVSYSDIIYGPDAIAALLGARSPIAITYDPNWLAQWEARFDDPLSDAESFSVDGGQLTDIGRSNVSMDEIQGQYMGLLRFRPEGWEEVRRQVEDLGPAKADQIHMTDLLRRIIEAGRVGIAAIPYTGPWAEVDDERDRRHAEGIFGT